MTPPGGADFKAVYAFNDANNYYFRVTLWQDIPAASGQFPLYANIYYDTDNNVNTGHLPGTIGSELLTQSGGGYQEKNGGFNEGGIDGFNVISLDYHETLMAASGAQAEAALRTAIADNSGKYVLVVEGSIPTRDDGVYMELGGRPAIQVVKEVSAQAAAVIAIGSCASWDSRQSSTFW